MYFSLALESLHRLASPASTSANTLSSPRLHRNSQDMPRLPTCWPMQKWLPFPGLPALSIPAVHPQVPGTLPVKAWTLGGKPGFGDGVALNLCPMLLHLGVASVGVSAHLSKLHLLKA